MKTWSAAAPGRAESSWLAALPWACLGVVDLAAVAQDFDRLIILAAHPDDETLGMGATAAALAALGLPVDVVSVTDGEASHPHSPVLTKDALAQLRREELAAAMDDLGLAAPRHWGLPDGGLTAQGLAEPLAALLRRHAGERLLLASPWLADGHADHDVLGVAARAAAQQVGVAWVAYPVWLWHWAGEQDVPAAELVLTCPSPESLHRRATALRRFESQYSTLGRAPGAGPVLTGQALERARRVTETLIDPDGVLPRAAVPGRVAPATFDAMFEHGDDPWHVESRWYEQRRQALIEAMLPSQRLGRVLDLGCSTGRLTTALAERATGVVAVDHSAEALRVARGRGAGNVEWHQGSLPGILDALEGPFDLVVLSEVGYFLDGASLLATLSGIQRLLADDGRLLTAHWQHPTREVPLDGPLVEAQLEALWPVLARYRDDDVTITLSVPHGGRA